jgi:hypothetical protein
VLTVPVVEGQMAIAAASVNSGTTLMSIADLSKLIVETHVNQVDVSRLTPKQKVHLVAFQLYENEDNRIARLKKKKPVLPTRSGESYNPHTLKNTAVIIPFTTFYYDYRAANIVGLVDQGPIQKVDGLTIQTVDAEHVQDAIDEVSALLTQTHRGVEDFTFDTRQELAESIEKPASSTPLSGALIAGISLIVGGILGLAATLGTTHLIKFTTDSASLPVFQTASVILSFAFAVLIGIYGEGRRFTFTSRGIAHHVRRSLHCPHFLSAGVLRVQLRPSAARRRQTHLRLTPMRPESPNHAL